MSAEDRAAQRRIPDDQFNEILRVIRETVRAEMRAERANQAQMFDARTLSPLTFLSGLEKILPPEEPPRS